MSALSLDQLKTEIEEWLVETFGPEGGDQGALEKFREEAQELYENPDDPHEAADVFITLVGHCYRADIRLLDAIAEKLAIIRTRTWERTGEGVYHHVKP